MTGDMLTSLSILFGIFVFFYKIWYQEIDLALKEQPSTHRADRDPQIKRLQGVFLFRVMPLLLMTSILCYICVPDAVDFVEFLIHGQRHRVGMIQQTFLLITAMFMISALYVAGVGLRLLALLVKIRSPQPLYGS